MLANFDYDLTHTKKKCSVKMKLKDSISGASAKNLKIEEKKTIN